MEDRIELTILRNLIFNEQYTRKVIPFIRSDYFSDRLEKVLFEEISKFINSYNSLITLEVLSIELQNRTDLNEDDFKDLYLIISKLNKDFVDLDWLISTTEKWCRDKAIYLALVQSIHIADGKNDTKTPDSIPGILSDALAVSFDNNVGHDYLKNYDDRYEFYQKKEDKIEFDLEYLNKITKGGLPRKTLNICLAGTGCHGKGTKVLLYDGSVKNVEDVNCGDILVGDDGTPRIVNYLIRDRGQMYRIKINDTEDEFIVNEDHILSLINEQTKEIMNISVRDYLTETNIFKQLHKSYYVKTPIQFNQKQLSIDPYFLGLYLGDKHVHNKLSDTFRIYELDTTETDFNKKFIPFDYKTSSIQDRLKLLAGLVDSVGKKISNGYYSITTNSDQLSKDVLFVSRSLCFESQITEKLINDSVFYEVFINTTSSFSQVIPCKIKRKQSSNSYSENDNSLHKDFSIEKLFIDDYYGFNLSGNNLYCLDNFIVTHNTGKSLFMCHLAASSLLQGKNVLYITLEMAEERIAERIDANLLNVPIQQLVDLPKHVFENKITNLLKKTQGTLIIKEYPTASAHSGHFKALLNELSLKKSFKPDIIFIDYLNICSSSRYKSNFSVNSYSYIKAIAEEIRGLAVEFNVPIFSATQTTRSGYCLDVKTQVRTTQGQKQISEIRVGDYVLSDTGYNEVLTVFPKVKKKSYMITLENGKKIICSEDHLFPTDNGELNIRKGLKEGMNLHVINEV